MIVDPKIKCRQRRKVTTCEQCYRYKECYEGISCEPIYEQGCLNLGYAIIGDVCLMYEKYYKQGKKKTCEYYKRWLCSQRPSVLSGEHYDGQALFDALEIKCRKKYGDIDELDSKRTEAVYKKILAYKEKVAVETDIVKKNKYLQKIKDLKGTINE